MAKRTRITRHPSSDIQGEGSWVTTAQLTVGEMREYRNAAKAEDFDAFELGVDILKTHVLEWDWVNDDGHALPNPKDEPDIINVLTDAETTFLTDLIHGSESRAKNS